MKKIIVTVEITIDENSIARKYPNFRYNYDLKNNLVPTAKAMIAFAKGHVQQERAIKSFGFSSQITSVRFK